MSIEVIRVVTRTESVYGIQNTYKKEFKNIYKWSKSQWGMSSEHVNNMLMNINAVFIAVENGTPVGCLFGRINISNDYNNSYIENILKSSTKDSIDCFKKYVMFFNEYLKQHKHQNSCSFLSYYIVDPVLRGRGIGSVLLNSFRKNCGDGYQTWVSDNDNSSWQWYLHKDATMVAAGLHNLTGWPGEENPNTTVFCYVYSNDKKKQKLIKEANCYMDFPENEIESYKKTLSKNEFATTIRVSDEADKYNIGYKYMTPWIKFIIIIDKYYLKSINDYEFIKELNDEQIREIEKYSRNGEKISVYKFKYA
jgi:hypothetical protein